MKKLFLRKNLTYIFAIVMIAVIIVLSIRTAARFSDFNYYLIQNTLESNIYSLELRLEESTNNSRAAAVSMSRYPDIIRAVEERDRESIFRILEYTYDLYQVDYYTITDAEGIVIARTHDPDSYGDSVVNQRNIKDALGGEVSSYFEEGTIVKVSVRTGAPVYNSKGELIGVVSAGVRFDTDETVLRFKHLMGADVTVFLRVDRIVTTIANDDARTGTGTMDPVIADVVMTGGEYAGEVEISGSWYETYYRPLLNADGEAFAVLFLGIPVDNLKGQATMLLIEVIVTSVMCIAISVILLRALKNSDAANKAKSAFLSTMSHEIRTPMNAILGITEILLHNDKTPHEMKTSLDKIQASGDLLLGIINDILDLSKIEAGKLDLVPIKYETASLISDTSQLNMMRIGSKPIEFELQVDDNLPARAFGDELRVKQILNNILSNAFKYTNEGMVTLAVSVMETMKPDSENGNRTGEYTGWELNYKAFSEESDSAGNITFVFRISDTGQGMTPEQLKKLGNEYSRFNIEVNRKTEGTGLGMSITKNLIHMMGGEMKVDSQPGKGTTFTVYLPQGKVGDEVLGANVAENLRRFRTDNRTQMKRSQISREYMPYGYVLVVDDVETNIFVARGLLAPYGLKIDSAGSGFEAIELLKKGNVYDVIFMDHMMPEMDGIETAKRIREMGYTAPIVALTADAVAGRAEMFLSCGFDDFISKPIDIRQMNTVLNKLIRDKQPPEVIAAAHKAAKADLQNSISPKLMESFLRDAEKSLSVFDKILNKEGPFDDKEIHTITVHAHGLKTALSIIGRQELSDIALDLELLGKEKNSEVIAAAAPLFVKALRELVEELQ